MGNLVGAGSKEYKLMLPAIQEMKVKESSADNIEMFEDFWKKGYFITDKTLGSGASCRVVRATIKNSAVDGKSSLKGRFKDKHQCAIKEMKRKDEFNPQSFVKEIAILHLLNGHPNLLKFENAYIDKKHYYIQTGLLKGGELFDRIHELKKFDEKAASRHIIRVLDAIYWCHKRHIVHRDLKPENMVYAVKGGGPESLVIIDFGDAKKVKDEESYEEFVGTAFYLPPEIVRARKGSEMKKSDVWSIGVITYVLLTGRPPFWGQSNKEILKKIIKGKVQFPKSAKLSATAKHFVLNLVQKRIEKRFGVAQALDHPFIKNHNKDILQEVCERNQIHMSAKSDKKRSKKR